VINWPASIILDRESDKSTTWIKEAVHIRKEGRQSLNRDEGSYTMSHTYDRFLASLSWQEPEEELNKLLLMKVSDRDQNAKVKNVGCVEVIVFLQYTQHY